MAIFKKLAFIVVLCASFSQAIAVRYPYASLPEDECPKGVVKVAYVALSDLTVPSDHPHMPGTNFIEVTAEPVYRVVDVMFRPGQLLPTVQIPADFPLDMNALVQPFLTHILAGRSVEEFPSTVPGFSRVTGKLVCDITLEERGVIGKRTLSLVQTPLDFFKELDREIRRIEQLGFLALCRHNPGLMSVMGCVLKGSDLRDVEYANLLDLGRIFYNAGMGVLKENEGGGFSLRIGRLKFTTHPSHNPSDMQRSMADFLRRAIPPQSLRAIENLFPAARIENSPPAAAAAAAAHASLELNEREASLSAERELAREASLNSRGGREVADFVSPLQPFGDFLDEGRDMAQPSEGGDLDEEGAQSAVTSRGGREVADFGSPLQPFGEFLDEGRYMAQPSEGGDLDEGGAQHAVASAEVAAQEVAIVLLAKQTEAATEIQRIFRGHVARTQFLKTKEAATTLQQLFRAKVAGKAARADYMKTREAIVDIQRVFRGFKARRHFQSVKTATVVLQRAARQYMQRARARAALNVSGVIGAPLAEPLGHVVDTSLASTHPEERDAQARAVGREDTVPSGGGRSLLDTDASEARRMLDVSLGVADVLEGRQRDTISAAVLQEGQHQQQDRSEITALLGGQPIGAAAAAVDERQPLDAVSSVVSGASGILSVGQGGGTEGVRRNPQKKKGGCVLL